MVTEPNNTSPQPAQQKPAAWMCHPFGDAECEFSEQQECENCVPLYTSPPAQRTWVGLTDEEINIAASGQSWKPFARAIEAKLKEKQNEI